MFSKIPRWLYLPLAFLFLALYLVGYNIYRHRSIVMDPPATVLTEEQKLEIKLMKGETVNINQATKEELMRLPGIGEVLAERILETRDELGGFQSVEELKKIKGIGDKLFRDIAEYVVLE